VTLEAAQHASDVTRHRRLFGNDEFLSHEYPSS
jgi:hypothetical protein